VLPEAALGMLAQGGRAVERGAGPFSPVLLGCQLLGGAAELLDLLLAPLCPAGVQCPEGLTVCGLARVDTTTVATMRQAVSRKLA